jgi:hypothetical protein
MAASSAMALESHRRLLELAIDGVDDLIHRGNVGSRGSRKEQRTPTW